MFSDKTGTLTENIMQFKKCTVDGKVYRYVHATVYLGRCEKKYDLHVVLNWVPLQQQLADSNPDLFWEEGSLVGNKG